jgi:hypothetical protein
MLRRQRRQRIHGIGRKISSQASSEGPTSAKNKRMPMTVSAAARKPETKALWKRVATDGEGECLKFSDGVRYGTKPAALSSSLPSKIGANRVN